MDDTKINLRTRQPWSEIKSRLFKKPDARDYLILFMLVMVFFVCLAYKYDIQGAYGGLIECEKIVNPNVPFENFDAEAWEERMKYEQTVYWQVTKDKLEKSMPENFSDMILDYNDT